VECCLEQEVETKKQHLATTSAGQLRNSSDSSRPRESAKNKHTKIKNKKIKHAGACNLSITTLYTHSCIIFHSPNPIQTNPTALKFFKTQRKKIKILCCCVGQNKDELNLLTLCKS
jgi:endonuclease IV